jgi:ribosomal 50S subunit-recycling heat shock protein
MTQVCWIKASGTTTQQRASLIAALSWLSVGICRPEDCQETAWHLQGADAVLNVMQASPSASGKARRRRLDDVCSELRPADARNVIQSWIVQGKVQVDGRVVTKAGTPIPPGAAVQINAVVPKFVCRWTHMRCQSCFSTQSSCQAIRRLISLGASLSALERSVSLWPWYWSGLCCASSAC